MWQQNRISSLSGLEEQQNEQPNCISRNKSKFVFAISCISAFLAVCGITYWCTLKFDAPYREVRFSVISLSVSGLNPNATISPPPVFHLVLNAEKAFKNSTHACLRSTDISILYNDVPIAKTSEDVGSVRSCYNMKKKSEFVILVTLLDVYQSRNLRQRLWEEREIAELDLEMKFSVDDFPSNSYHVACNNVMLGAPDVPISCNATMKVRLL